MFLPLKETKLLNRKGEVHKKWFPLYIKFSSKPIRVNNVSQIHKNSKETVFFLFDFPAAYISYNIVRTSEERLLDRLLSQYDVDARGVNRVTDTLNVNIQLYLVRIQDLVNIYLMCLLLMNYDYFVYNYTEILAIHMLIIRCF